MKQPKPQPIINWYTWKNYRILKDKKYEIYKMLVLRS